MFKNMKIRSKMLVSYLAMTLLLIIVGVASMIMLQQVSGKLQQFYDQHFDDTVMADRFQSMTIHPADAVRGK